MRPITSCPLWIFPGKGQADAVQQTVRALVNQIWFAFYIIWVEAVKGTCVSQIMSQVFNTLKVLRVGSGNAGS